MSTEAKTENQTGPAPDRAEIVRVVQLYIDGFNECDPGKLREAFHPDARIAYTNPDGTLESGRIYDSVDEWGTDQDGANIYGRTISVTQAGDVACVVLGFDYLPNPAEGWIDIHSLLKIDGTWKIMNKTATHASRGGWAALQPAS